MAIFIKSKAFCDFNSQNVMEQREKGDFLNKEVNILWSG